MPAARGLPVLVLTREPALWGGAGVGAPPPRPDDDLPPECKLYIGGIPPNVDEFVLQVGGTSVALRLLSCLAHPAHEVYVMLWPLALLPFAACQPGACSSSCCAQCCGLSHVLLHVRGT